MADPQKPAPPAPLPPELPFETLPSDKPWSRWVAEELGIAPAVDAVQSTVDNAGRWFRSHLLGMSPEDQAHFLQLGEEATTKVAAEKARQQASWDALKKRVGSSAPAQRLGPVLAEQYGPSVTPSAQTKAVAEVLRQGITEKSDALRAALPKAPTEVDWGALAPGFAKAPTGDPLDKGRSTVDPLKPIDWMVGAQHDWIPNTLVDIGEQSATPAGALMNFGDVGPVLHGAGALAAKLGVGAAHLAGTLPPGFFSRVDQVAEAVGKKGIHPNKLASLLKSGASSEEVAYRRLPELIAGKGQELISKEELAAHLAAHPPPEIGRTVLGASTDPAHVHAAREVLANRHLLVDDPLTTLQQAYPRASEAALRDALDAAHDPNYPAGPAKYSSHTLPGGENYRESLTQLATPTAKQGRYRVEIREPTSTPPGYRVRFTDPNVSSTDVEQLRQRYTAPYMVHFEEIETPLAAGSYTAGHFTEPNVLVHARTTERTLPGTTGAPPPPPYVEPAPGALAAEGWTVRIDREDPYTGSRQMSLINPQGEWAGSRGMTRLTPEEYLHTEAVDRAKTAYKQAQIDATAPTGPRGRFLEEVQSDWHQQGKEQGYRSTPATEAEIGQLKAKMEAAQVAHAVAEVQIGQDLNARDVLFLSQIAEPGDTVEQVLARVPERWGWQTHRPGGERAQALFTQQAREFFARHPDRSPVSSSWNAMNQLRQTEEAATQARQAYHARVNTNRVPDAPFKETWPDLALKQQLLDVAHRQDLSWLGFTSGKTQAERYDLAKQVSKIDYDPTERYLRAFDHQGNVVIEERVEPEELADHIGKEPAEKLRAQIEGHEQRLGYERSQWSTEIDPETGHFLITDPNGEVLHNYHGNPEQYSTEERAHARIDQLLHDDQHNYGHRDLPMLEGLDLQVGGEGMTHFYDQLLPRRLEKLVKPFGGTVEKGAVPTTKEMPTYQPGILREVDTTEPAWIAHLSPDMKERIRKQGFPLLSFLPPALIGGGAAAAASQLGGDDPDHPGAAAGLGLAAALPFIPGMRRPGLTKASRAMVEEARLYLQNASLRGPIARDELAEILQEAPLWGHAHRVTKDLPVEPPLKRASKILTPGERGFDFSPGAETRLHGMADIGAALPAKANWGGATDPAMAAAFNHDPQSAELYGRFFAALSPRTSVPKNSLEALSVWDQFLRHPKRPFTDARMHALGVGNVRSKTDNIMRAILGEDPSGEKVDLFTDYMTGHAILPVPDVHGLYAMGSAKTSIDKMIPELRRLVQKFEGIPAVRGGLTNKDYVRRLVDAFGRSLQAYDPAEPMGPLFGSTWEGTRAQKGLPFQGGMIDIYKSRGLAEPGAMFDLPTLKQAIRDWSKR